MPEQYTSPEINEGIWGIHGGNANAANTNISWGKVHVSTDDHKLLAVTDPSNLKDATHVWLVRNANTVTPEQLDTQFKTHWGYRAANGASRLSFHRPTSVGKLTPAEARTRYIHPPTPNNNESRSWKVTEMPRVGGHVEKELGFLVRTIKNAELFEQWFLVKSADGSTHDLRLTKIQNGAWTPADLASLMTTVDAGKVWYRKVVWSTYAPCTIP